MVFLLLIRWMSTVRFEIHCQQYPFLQNCGNQLEHFGILQKRREVLRAIYGNFGEILIFVLNIHLENALLQRTPHETHPLLEVKNFYTNSRLISFFK